MAPRVAAVFFDLDGTLVDSRPGIEESLRAAFARHVPGSQPPPIGDLLGRPLTGLLEGALAGLDQTAMPALAATFAEHYDAEGWRLSRPYPDVVEALGTLAAAGVRQVLVTNKRLRPTKAILEACGLASFLERVVTPDMARPPYPDKAAMGRAACDACGVSGKDVLVVGDSVEDRLMAEASGAVFSVAGWGYGDAAATAGRHGHIVLHGAAEIVDLVLGRTGCEAST
jgi:phosphoglycolate phosphatase